MCGVYIADNCTVMELGVDDNSTVTLANDGYVGKLEAMKSTVDIVNHSFIYRIQVKDSTVYIGNDGAIHERQALDHSAVAICDDGQVDQFGLGQGSSAYVRQIETESNASIQLNYSGTVTVHGNDGTDQQVANAICSQRGNVCSSLCSK